MICKACNKVPSAADTEDCFEKALDIVKQHYTYYKNALQQRDLELQQIKERNDALNKALQLLQKNKEPPAKRFKSQQTDDSWLGGHNSFQDNATTSDLSLTDDERLGASNLNMAINSEQLFDTSALSQSKNDVSINNASEMVHSPQVKVSPKRNKQRDDLLSLKRGANRVLQKSKTEWQGKERTSSPVEKSWTMKCLQATKVKSSPEDKGINEMKTTATDKKLKLSLKKTNPSKMKQSLIHFNKSKENSFRESDTADDIIDASPVIPNKNSKAGRSWAHRSGQTSHINQSSNSNNNTTLNNPLNQANKTDVNDTTVDDIIFDFSPTKKTDSKTLLDSKSLTTIQPKQLKYDNDMSTDCTALPNDALGFSGKSDSSSVVILTPNTQDIIFVDDTCNEETEPEIDTMDLMADNLDFLKEIETKYIQKQQQEVFKKPLNKQAPDKDLKPLIHIKKEKVSQDLKDKEQDSLLKEEKPTCSSNNNTDTKSKIPQNPLFSSDEPDTEEDDEDYMPKPFIIKQEPTSAKANEKLSIKERFNIDCEDCEKLINFLDKGLTDAQIRVHLDKCKRHNNNNDECMRQNTPQDFWNPFILSFQADDPRNEVLIDTRFKDKK